MTELRALLVVSLACAGCATTGGHDWLSSPVEERAELRAEVLEAPPSPSESRPRLSQTVTLGETYGTGATPAASSGGPAMQVNVHTQVPVVINNYSGYGYGYGYGSVAPVRAAPARATSGAPTKVGGDFPAPPDYGPRALK
ncbi:MAG TPA: hypothetical protein VHP33_36920 [Polyangiaceae bacterium]|nr:hypothetical protein [Polyangiaceae bacterium]